MILIYHILVSAGFVLALPFLPLVWLFSRKRRASLVQRLGARTGFAKKKPGTSRIWVHALSVGEVRSAIPLVRALAEGTLDSELGQGQFKAGEIIFTASTKTGFETAQSLLGTGENKLVSQIGYFPFDLWFSILKVVRIIEPDLVCLVETDYWPAFLNIMKKKKIPVVLANARMSVSSLKGYNRLGPLKPLFFSPFSHVMAQTPRDKDRFGALGIARDRILVAGNMKFDQGDLADDGTKENRLRSMLGIRGDDRVWIAGSTHEGEETIILEVFARLRKELGDLRLILAPRDPERCKALSHGIQRHNTHGFVFWSDLEKGSCTGQSHGRELVLMDVMGVLAPSYAVCDLAFIGGSLVPLGGHNPLEPAMFGKPVLFGPHMTDFQGVADLLKKGKGAMEVAGADELEAGVKKLLEYPEFRDRMGRAGARIFRVNSGAVGRTVAILEKICLG